MFFKTIILVPNPNLSGGVSNYYQVAEKYFSENVKYVYFNSKYPTGFLKLILNILYLLKTILIIGFCFPKKVVVNPSLNKVAFIRDGLLVLYSLLFLKETIVFWRGWNPDNESIFQNKFLYKLFKLSYKKANKNIVLNSHVKQKLVKLGICESRIYLTNTLVDDSYLAINTNFNEDSFNILFLTRIEKYKGIYETLEIFKQLNFKNAELHIAGDGNELENVKKKVIQEKINNVKFFGHITGKEKVNVFKNADVYLFPSYNEGMPNSVLEAMGIGLPVVCTNVGALKDFFIDGEMGFKNDLPININTFADNLKSLYLNEDLKRTISRNNKNFAQNTFLASNSIKKLEKLLNT